MSWKHLSKEEGQQKIKDDPLVKLSMKTCPKWRLIADQLPDAANPGDLAFPLGGNTVREIANDDKNFPDEQGKMLEVFIRWRGMNPAHTWGYLYDTLYECGYGHVTHEIWQTAKSPPPKR